MAIEVEIVCDEVRAALILRLTDSPAADWRVSEEEAEMVLSALKAPGLPPAAVAEFETMVEHMHQLRDATDRQFRRSRLMNHVMMWASGFFAVSFGASYAANGRLTDLICSFTWGVVVGANLWGRYRLDQPNQEGTK